jgi:Metallo-beta-lactamase superfamily
MARLVSHHQVQEFTMFEVSRREIVVGAGMAAALGLSSRLVIDPAFAQKTAAPAKGFVNYKVGDAEVTAIYDGIFEKPHDPTFISNASVDDVKDAMTKAGLPADFVSISGTVSVVKNGGKTILCDAGTGGYAPGWVSGNIANNMKAAGIDPAKIDIVLISHFHPDHIFGLMAKDTNAQIYPNAEIVVSDVEYKFWTDPADLEEHAPGHGCCRCCARHDVRHGTRSHARPSRLPAGVGQRQPDAVQRHDVCAGPQRCPP